MTTTPSTFIVGWQEWLALPELGLPAIKAKIDTGARTSALHAFLIEPFGPAEAPMVRFGVNPIPGRLDVAVFCSAAVTDRREVTSSNGERETRYFIRTPVELGGRTWEIEIGLTNRESMSYRMLLGRQAIRDDVMVDVATSFRQPRLGYKLYRGMPRTKPARRALRIALVARDVGAAFNRRLAEAAARQGHIVEPLDLARLTLAFADDAPGLALDGARLPHFDAVVPRVGLRDGPFGAAVVRQLESMGGVSLNAGDALDRLANRLATAQALSLDAVPHRLDGDGATAAPFGPALRALVVGDEAIALLRRDGADWKAAGPSRHRAERRLAEHAAAALRLGLAAVDLDIASERPCVLRVSSRPMLSRFARLTETDVAGAIVGAVEKLMQSRRRRRVADAAP